MSLDRKIELECLKFHVSKQMFCQITGKILDYRNAIAITATKDRIVKTLVLDGSLEDKVESIVNGMWSIGYKTEVVSNIKKK